MYNKKTEMNSKMISCEVMEESNMRFLKWNKFYNSNPIVHFWISYATVLLIPLAIVTLGLIGEFYAVNEDINASNLSKMEHSVQLIDGELDLVEAAALRLSVNSFVKDLASKESINDENILQFKNSIKQISNVIYQQSTRIKTEKYIYFNKLDYIIFEESLYQEELFSWYLEGWRVSQEEWKEIIVAEDLGMAKYYDTCNDYLHYSVPINIRNGKNDGMVVYMLNISQMIDSFSFVDEYGDWAFYILDSGNEVLFSRDTTENRILNLEKMNIPDIFSNTDVRSLLYTKSPKRNWTYCVILPDNAVAHRVYVLRWLAFTVGTVEILIGFIVTVYLAVREGKPMNYIFSLLGEEQSSIKNSARLGEIVSGILNSNKELLEEQEQSKPLLKKAFFHDLITLDVANTKELTYLAENAEINLETDRFRMVSVRLFENNDFYDVDEQTLKDIKVIILGMQNYMEENCKGNIWFYQRNYLSLLIVMEEEYGGVVLEQIEQTYQWLRNTFSTESDWGISRSCENIMNIWKYCEEAEIARDHCEPEQHIAEYQIGFEDKYTFYFPEIAQEKLENGIYSGDNEVVGNILKILEEENFKNRRLSRNSVIKLNSKVTNFLMLFESQDAKISDSVMELNQLILDIKEFSGYLYFDRLKKICNELCNKVKKEKGIQRNKLIEDIQNYIKENYQDASLGLATISIKFGISEGYVSTLFKEQTEINFTEYVETIRLKRACTLLKERRNTIEEIAAMVGYNSVHSFRRAFKRVHGMSPRDYR